MIRISLVFLVLTAFISAAVFAQKEEREPGDSIINQDQLYNRPFISMGGGGTAIGGYVEGNTNYFVESGIQEGFSMELRRFNVFLYSSIANRIRFLSELEFEHGVKEINLETAMIDIDIAGAGLVFRGGIILPPVGQFNVNHDSPKWEFVERPMVSQLLIPSTLSEIGFGLYGKQFAGSFIFSYDLYLVNGLQDQIIANAGGRTFLPAGKGEDLVSLDNNGIPAMTGRLGLRKIGIGEIGASIYSGIYNSFRADGEIVDEKRRVTILAGDYKFRIGNLSALGEFATASIDVPASMTELFGDRQWGGFLDLIYPIVNQPVKTWAKSAINLCVRLEKVDFNVGNFSSTLANIGDDVRAVSPGLSFRTGPDTVIRANYRHHWIHDILGNPVVHRGGFQAGIASYF